MALGWPRNIVSPLKDKMYDLGLLSKAKKQMQGQGLAPAARKSLKKQGPQETITAFLRAKEMKPLNYFEQIIRMPNKADKFDLRLRMVKYAVVYGKNPPARAFDTTANTVRKWLNR